LPEQLLGRRARNLRRIGAEIRPFFYTIFIFRHAALA